MQAVPLLPKHFNKCIQLQRETGGWVGLACHACLQAARRGVCTWHCNGVEVAVISATLAKLHVALKAHQLFAVGRKAGAQRRQVPAGDEARGGALPAS